MCGQPGYPKVRDGGPRPLTHPSSFHRPGHAVSVAHRHLWERLGQQRHDARLHLWKGRLRPGWGAVCAPWTPARGSGGLVHGARRCAGWFAPCTSRGLIRLAEAGLERPQTWGCSGGSAGQASGLSMDQRKEEQRPQTPVTRACSSLLRPQTWQGRVSRIWGAGFRANSFWFTAYCQEQTR